MSKGQATREAASGAEGSCHVTPLLLAAKTIPDVFRRASKILQDSAALNCKNVTFYVRSNGTFSIAYSTADFARPLTLAERPLIRSLLRGEMQYLINGRREIILPIRSRCRFCGLAILKFAPRSRMLNGGAGGVTSKAKWLALEAIFCAVSSAIENIQLQRKVRRQSIIDPLTRVYNRGYFDRQARNEVLRAKRYNKKIAYILVDLDNLKDINDAHGHMEGDNVLRSIGRILKRYCRQIDLVCRYGGDEFVIVLLETGVKDALKKAESLRRKIENHQFRSASRRERIAVSTSIGVSALEGKIADHDALFRAADRALYKAKKGGKNRCCRCV